ncbi:hypothetical protein C7974DRAFT_200478 [Boeremia exigua]|uniref:uncharacterized protein n=1 Tax=Boeremia exigua TaxID=749465 RepID=UPI001E8ED753|nr:uncharacterized protein C7974DRAFT_200478 [Boeremia exigua]KAH6625376.1 hypothetical protein C7974DRAFT_200478 [Boeremia exigua]
MAVVLFVIAAVVILPFLTYYVTSALFFRTANSTIDGKKPATVPYFIPAVFHSFGFLHWGAPKYFAELIKDYGSFAPFRIRVGLRSIVILRDPTHVSRVLNAPEHLTATASEVEILDKIFRSPRAGKHLQQTKADDSENGDKKTLPFDIPDATLESTTEAYISILSANMQDKMFQSNTWTSIEDLWSFLQLVSLRCTLETFFGSALLKKYPRILRDFVMFDAAIEGYVHGMPRLLISGASKSRDRLYQGVGSWLSFESGAEHADDLVWNQVNGMGFIREHYRALKVDNDEEVNLKARVAEVLSIIHATNTALVSPIFWTVVETLRKSHLTRNMTNIVDKHLSPKTRKYDIPGLLQEPLAKSLQTEVQRLRTATCVVRTNETDGYPLDKQWSLGKGATVVIFSHDIALNKDLWKKLQPQALERPLEEFWAERFMVPDRKSKSKKGVVTTGDVDADNLGDLLTRLTVSNQYPGSRLVSSLRMATVALLFADFEIELCEPEYVDAILPLNGELAYGHVKPLDKIVVRIRKRKH